MLPWSLGLWMFASVHPVAAQQGTLRPGSTLYRIQGREPSDALGQDFAVLGDVDGDGVNDFATSGSSRYPEATVDGGGHVDLYSGRDGSLLRRWLGDEEFGQLGTALVALPDADQDGVSELGAATLRGSLKAFSPATGEELFTIAPHDDLEQIAADAAALSVEDQNDDGIEEFAYVDTFALRRFGPTACILPGPTCVRGRLQLHCGRTGKRLWTFLGSRSSESLQPHIVAVGDRDGDGVGDLLVPQWPETSGGALLFVFSGRDGRRLETFDPEPEFATWGRGLTPVGDHDGDGLPELLFTAIRHRRNRGWVGVHRFPGFERVWERSGVHPQGLTPDGGLSVADQGDQLGRRTAPLGDVDGDGVPEVLVGTHRGRSGDFPARFGRLYLLSGRSGKPLVVYEGNHNSFGDSGGTGQSHVVFFEHVAPLGDVDRDGFVDFLISRPVGGLPLRSLIGEVRVVRYVAEGPRFMRGDADGDGRISIADAITILRSTFGGAAPRCAAAHDADRDARISILDVLRLVQFVFLPESEEPAPPFPDCARYSTVHAWFDLGCEDEGSCRP